ncbi:MAG: galactokinase [Phycisphaeraceae bacterium]|nr:MAG: galactokinase [Phycisphaeraceae bacterium]
MNSSVTAGGAERLAALACERYERRFGRRAAAVAAAPGRVNLLGDHTDYNEGFALPMAIDRRAVVAAGPGGSERCRVVSLAMEEEAEFALEAPAAPGWGAYAHGVAIELAKLGDGSAPFDAVIASDVPLGGGLSSSAAIEVAMCLALEAMWGIKLDPLERAKLCSRAEREYTGTPCGLMDQLVACRAVAGAAMLIDFRSNESTSAPIFEQDVAIVIAHSGVAHALGDGAYAQRRAECERAAALAGAASLRDVTEADLNLLAACGDEIALRRARHVVRENHCALHGAEALRQRNYEWFGRLMNVSHASLRDDFESSCPEIDALVRNALSLPGVLGARMTGGGFGGCIVAMVRVEAAAGCVERLIAFTDGNRSSCFLAQPSAGAALMQF